MKKFLSLLLVTFVCLTSVAMAAENPVKIARLPIIVQQNKLDNETAISLEVKLARAVNIPLNKTLKIAEYVPPKKSAAELNKIWQKMYKNDTATISDAVKTLAEKLNADIVVCPILREYSQNVTHSGLYFESHLSSFVSAEMIIYDRRTDSLTRKKVSRSFNDAYNKYGTAARLAANCFDQLIKDTELRQLIHNLRG